MTKIPRRGHWEQLTYVGLDVHERTITVAMLGIALNSPTITRRILGTTEISRSARRMRSARSTANCCDAGISAALTITKSKTFQPLRKKLRR